MITSTSTSTSTTTTATTCHPTTELRKVGREGKCYVSRIANRKSQSAASPLAETKRSIDIQAPPPCPSPASRSPAALSRPCICRICRICKPPDGTNRNCLHSRCRAPLEFGKTVGRPQQEWEATGRRREPRQRKVKKSSIEFFPKLKKTRKEKKKKKKRRVLLTARTLYQIGRLIRPTLMTPMHLDLVKTRILETT